MLSCVPYSPLPSSTVLRQTFSTTGGGRHGAVRVRFFAPCSGLSCREAPQPSLKGADEPWIDGEFSTSWPRVQRMSNSLASIRLHKAQHARKRAAVQARLRATRCSRYLVAHRQLQLAKDGGVKPAHQKPASSTQPSCCAKPLQSKPCIAARRVRPGRRATEGKQVVL